MNAAAGLGALPPEVGSELAPVLRRAVNLDPAALARIRTTARGVQVLARLPFQVVVPRTVATGEPVPGTIHFTVPDEVVRGLVRSGALALKDAAAREGVPGAQPRAEVADALLDSVVLTVEEPNGRGRAEITLRAISAVTRMAFLPRGSYVAVDVSGRWIRVAAAYGSVFLERAGLGLGLLG